ncbi:hypothetical protein B0T18DRAFT_395935 [Schizothecium vesticola]|uniref:RRM domain-containing protein n=1 Tax=Schizothecium vesticola TaxID=314040 RepID=A0AA40KBV3_9PEZI|nr:hypothetical protein B0T18DRAFT_395935 [Schizothecium vesticola]
MASNGSSTVTIDRDYFDLLVRRAKFNHETFNGIPTVTISQVEYDELQGTAKQYENLRRNLLRGGVDNKTVDLLSQDDDTIQARPTAASTPAPTETDGGAALSTASTVQRGSGAKGQGHTGTHGRSNSNGHYRARHGSGSQHHNHSAWADDEGEMDGDVSGDENATNGVVGATYVKSQNQNQRQQFERQATRTIQLLNLAEGTTHADITSAVRGGMLLDVFLRAHERSATVSFLHAEQAKRFFDFVRRHDLYIKNKRIDIKWNDRQFILPGHVAGKIGQGASRNLVVHQYDGRHSEENIREDLDHIHNCVVVKVTFSGGNCYISLNSVHNAIYARNCMMSRFKYKGTKIEWDVDECAQPFVVPPPKPRREAPQPKKAPIANRFQLLNIDDEDEDEEIAPAFGSKKTVGVVA